MLPYINYFWDFDGTLFDTYPLILADFKKALLAAGLFSEDSVPSYQTLLKQAKGTLLDTAVMYAGGDRFKGMKLMDVYQAFTDRRTPEEFIPYRGAEKVLSAIRARGGKSYLYTHRDQSAQSALEHAGLWKYFADAVSKSHHFPRKPAPDALNYLIEKHGLDRACCCMVGDRSIDLDAAKNAGIHTVLFDPEGFYPDYPADNRFTDFETMSGQIFPIV